MPLSDPTLWKLIETWPLPYREEVDKGVNLKRTCTSFEHNVRKIGDWTEKSVGLLTQEYRRFLYLKALEGGELTPPKCLDDVWHLHLEIDPNNMEALVSEIGRPVIHHTGLSHRKAVAAYERLRHVYEREFGQKPDRRVWPSVWRAMIGPSCEFIAKTCLIVAVGGLAATGLVVVLLRIPEVGVWQALLEVMDDGNGGYHTSGPIVALRVISLVALMLMFIAVFADALRPKGPETIARCG